MSRLIATTALLSIAAAPALAEQHTSVSYCEQAFAPADTNADNMIDETEATAARDAQFASIDVNSDGTLTREEWTNCTTAGTDGRTASAAPEDLYPQLDADNSGDISPSELFDGTRTAYEDVWTANNSRDDWADPTLYTQSGVTNEMMGDWTSEEYFAQVGNSYAMTDTDDSGSVSREEFMNRAEGYEVDISKVNARFDSMDGDSDDMVSREEFDAAQTARIDRAMDGFTDSSKGVPVVIWYGAAM